MKRSLQIVKYSVFIPLLSLVLLPQAMESASLNSLPKSEDIFTIAINPIPSGPASTARYFTPESLHEALPNFKRGEAEIKPGARRVWESGVIVLNNREVLFWTTCRKNFIHVLTPNGHVSFIIGDGKDDL